MAAHYNSNRLAPSGLHAHPPRVAIDLTASREVPSIIFHVSPYRKSTTTHHSRSSMVLLLDGRPHECVGAALAVVAAAAAVAATAAMGPNAVEPT